MGKEIKKRVKGCPEVKISQGSNGPSHGPSCRANSGNLDPAMSVDLLKKYSTRYVYAKKCNPSVVEWLLNSGKTKAITMSRNRTHTVPVKKYQCTGSTAKGGVSKGVDHRSYAQVVAEEAVRPAELGSSNGMDHVKGIDQKQWGTYGMARGRHKGVRYFSSNATQGGHCPSRATTNSIACVSTAEDRGIVVTCDTASHSDPCATSKETHAESLKGHNNSRSFIMSVVSLGQTATTTNTADLSCPVGKGHEVHPIKLNQVGKLKQCDHVVSEVAHPGVSDGCKIYDINGLDEKYMASILIKTPKKNQWKNSDNELVKAWKRQTDFQFGFIPLSDVQHPESKEINYLQDYCPIKAHKMVANHKKPNYLGARIKVDSQLNLQEWYDQLQDYWDQQLLEFLTFGFPLDFNRNSPLYWEGENHKSALEYPQDIEAYLKEEMQFKAIVGPFDQHPCDNGHISPFMTRDKPGSDNRRVIIDLSWPLGGSVNSGIDKESYMGTEFALVLPTVDHITDQLKVLGRGAHLYKIDISRAFRHIKVDPLDYDLLGLHWRHVYVDTCVPFGSRHGSQIFQRVSDAVRHIMRRHGHKVINYVDDYVGFGVPSDARASYDLLYDLLQKLGLTVSQKKLVPPATLATCLGVEINTITGTIAIPAEKLRQICDTVKQWKHRKRCSRRQLQSLLGHLLYIHKCVKPARYFLNRMLNTLRTGHGQATITLDPEFHRNLRWFERFLPLYNGVSLYDHKKCDHQVHLDACLQGLGGVWQNIVYHLQIPPKL